MLFAGEQGAPIRRSPFGRDTMVRAGQSSEKAALIYQHSDHERQKEVASGLDKMVRAARGKGAEQRKDGQGGAEVVRDA